MLSSPSSVSLLFPLKSASQFGWVAPCPCGLARELPSCVRKGQDTLPLRRHRLFVSVQLVQETIPMDPENWQWVTGADHLVLCGCWAVVAWVSPDVFLLPCSATDPPPRIRIINGYITVEPQPRGHGRSTHTRADTSSAHQPSHSPFLPLLTLTLYKIMLH